MKTTWLIVLTVAACLHTGPALSQIDRKLVVEPALPDTSQAVKIWVTNSRCFTSSEVRRTFQDVFDITLTYLFEPSERCLAENPNATDFETTVGPLPVGTYRVGLFVNYGGHGGDVADSRVFSVVDAQPVTANLSEGGINGLYHDPQAPHRYFYVLETNYNTLLVWNTFDADGNPAWIYGVGQLDNDGSTVIADAYVNSNENFVHEGDSVEAWGLLRLDMRSCVEGTVTYQSNDPDFGNGQFEVARLAYSKQIGCSDSD